MRPALKAQNTLERIAIGLNLAPVPAGEAMFEPAAARILVAGVRLGVFERLAAGSASVGELAAELGTEPRATELLVDALAGLDYLSASNNSYTMTKRARKWLDPASETYIGT